MKPVVIKVPCTKVAFKRGLTVVLIAIGLWVIIFTAIKAVLS